jgi:hypothetical protein
MPARDDSSAASHRKSWSARFSPHDVSVIERGAALTHCGVASRFVERAFVDYAAQEGAIQVSAKAPLVVAESKKRTLDNIIVVQGALVLRLTRSARRGTSTLIARQSTLTWLSQYLIAGTARPEVLPPTPLPGPLPSPLNLRLLPIHLDLLAKMAGDDLGKIDVLSAALRRQAENIGLNDDDPADEFGVPRTWLRYPHPELLSTTTTIEDTLLALIIAYRSLDPFKRTLEWVQSATALMSEVPRIKLSKILDE